MTYKRTYLKMPKEFVDVNMIIELTMFQCLRGFWEEDCGEESLRYQYEADYTDWLAHGVPPEEVAEHREKCKQLYDKMLAAYSFFKEHEEDYVWSDHPDKVLHVTNIFTYRDYLWS